MRVTSAVNLLQYLQACYMGPMNGRVTSA